MTHDWLDLAVEHLSRFIRQLNLGQEEILERLVTILMRYMDREPPAWPKETAFSHTMAVIPIFMDESTWHGQVSLDGAAKLDNQERNANADSA